MITEQLIYDRIKSFLWYGDINSDIRFVGMEEWFWWSIEDLEIRLLHTDKKEVVDIFQDMKYVKDHIKRFIPNAPIQRTLSKLILLQLFINWKKNINNDIIRHYQTSIFGRSWSNTCNLEFMPLPCRSINKKDWVYSKFNIEGLSSRKEYIKTIMPKRIRLFKEKIAEYRPKIVIFYSLSYKQERDKIIGNTSESFNNIFYNKTNSTSFFIVPHPTAHWYTKEDWINIAKNILYVNNQ